MATIAAFKISPTAARWKSSSSTGQSSAESGRWPGERRCVSCSIGSSLRFSRGWAHSFPARLGSLNSVAEPMFVSACALPHRRALRFFRCSSPGEKSEATVDEAAKELEKQGEESKAVYNEAVDGLKDHSEKLQESPAAERAGEVLRDTTEKLREEAENARVLLTATVTETAESGKSNLNRLAESAPDPIKGIAETAANAHLKGNTRQGAKIHDFCLGIPYGAFLVAGGLLWFILTGSTAAIRSGVILGGLLLLLSVTSLKVWKEGKSSIPYIQGQAVIAFIIFLQDARKFFEAGAFFPTAISALASGGILAFYAYVYLSGGNPPKKVKITEPTAAT